MAQDISIPEGLAAAIDGRSDDEINAAIGAQGVDATLDRVFEGMAKQFMPGKAAGQSVVVQWDIDAPDGRRTYQVNIADGTCTAMRGTGAAPRVTLGLKLPDFLRVITGKLNGQQAFFTGKLKLTGDIKFAQTQRSFFNQPR
jgi:putative sterol carrier protein